MASYSKTCWMSLVRYNNTIDTMEDFVLNDHNKEEFPPAHTAEHLLNQTMIRLFGCGRSYNA